jgi:EAL domain-containing protein (putative c-di-GMP-specific phosphodiesterase class I)
MCLQYNMLEKLKECMEKYGIPERMICLMVSEYTVSRSGAAFREGVEEFRKKGIRFCLEDYGSGFTSMTSIIEIPFSIIKINRTVVRSAMANEKARVTMESTLVMARELGMITGVDGINEAASFRMISDMDCDMAKGNYFFEELDPEEFIKVLHMSAEAAEKGGAE